MKKIIVFTCALLVMSATTNAQGLLGRLKEKIGQTGSGSSSGTSAKDLVKFDEQGKKDKENNFLDSKPFEKENPHEMNGIYFSTRPVRVKFYAEENKYASVQKFHINYKKNTGNIVTYEIATAYSFDKSDTYKWVEPYVITSEKNDFIKDKRAGLAEFRNVSNHFMILDGKYGKENGAYPKTESLDFKGFRDIRLFFVEPGIIIGFDNKWDASRFNPKSKDHDADEVEAFKKFHNPIVFYTKEKESKALAITNDQMHDMVKSFNIKKLGNFFEGGEELPRPGNSSLSPIFTSAKNQVMAVMKSYLAKEGMEQYVPVYNYIFNDYASFGTLEMPHPTTGIKVTSGRTVTFFVVCKNLKTKPADGHKFFSSDYVFFRIMLGEDVLNNQYNSNNFTGKWYVWNTSTPLGILATENPMKYKGK
jgi:hypothetical protein